MRLPLSSPTQVTGEGLPEGFLSVADVRAIAREGLDRLPVDGKKVIVLIPDGTRTMPMPLIFEILQRELAPRTRQLDFLVALGTHTPLDDQQLSKLLAQSVSDGAVGRSRIFNHQWDNPSSFAVLGEIPAHEITQITAGLENRPVVVSLNKRILDYDHILIAGPVFPHEVAGFSGGAKYFFPGIAGPDIIHFTHWLGALLTSFEIIGAADTAVRQVIHRAAELVPVPHSLLAPVVLKEGVAGLYCGPTVETWKAASELSGQRHIVWLDKPVERVLAIMPEMYEDLWTGAKGMYKMEPVVSSGGEVVIYAPHIREVSVVHGRLIDEIGYHCRDYFLGQWSRFKAYPGGILAHSTHLKGQGAYDRASGEERPRIRVTLATGIPADRCARLNLGYLDPAGIDADEWASQPGCLVVPRAGEMLYRLKGTGKC